jgi:hypothetical protein
MTEPTGYTTNGDRPIRRNALAAGKLLAAAAGLALLTHVSWNMFAPDLFGLPELRIKQALGLVGFGFVLATLLRQARPRHG